MRDYHSSSSWAAVESTSAIEADPGHSHAQGWAGLLHWVYARAGLKSPRLEQLKPRQVPRPYRDLLAHSADMTPTLEGFFEQPLGLRVLSRDLEQDCYRREVVLTLGCEKRPVLYGAIRILLEHLPPNAKAWVLKELLPLGRILQAESIPHMSWPQTFFRVEPDRHMIAMLHMRRKRYLYGRRNILVDGSRRLLAEVIEVLAPEDSGRKRAS